MNKNEVSNLLKNEKMPLYSWTVIILAFCVFWPVGLFLLFKRVSTDKKTAMIANISIKTIGVILYVFAGFFAFFSIILLTDKSDPANAEGFITLFVIALIFGIGGFFVCKYSKKISKNAQEIKKYMSVVVNGNTRQLDAVASAMDKSYDVVKKDIQDMINKGFLKNAYINEGTREVVFAENNSFENVNINNAPKKIIACPCCGANNTLIGDMGECEYCGSPLK